MIDALREKTPEDDVPGLPTLVGLRSPVVAVALGVLAVGYAAAMIGTSGPATGWVWAAQIFAYVLQLLCVLTAISIPTDPLPSWAAAVVASASLGGLAIAWWFMASDSEFWVQVTVPSSLTAVVAGVIALRGRFVVAVLMVAATMVLAGVWAHTHAQSTGLVIPMSNRVLGTVLPAVLVASILRPILRLMGELRERELAAVRHDAARQATQAERDARLDDLARDVGPILQRIADGDSFDDHEALRLRLLEHTLRDEVRGRAWDSEGVRVAATAARARGVSVQLFDDGGLGVDGLTAVDAERLRGELIRVLGAVDSGAVTARVLPPGRDRVALITVVHDDAVTRRDCVRTSVGLRWE
ncbi:MAG: hypothetical protein QM809_07855 [Gordonia sp. (in: high G+C Gram-positive bacteria)]|uniref:hypothetical protein n=1 Tax=Gordonia sp. (in: high G+C Gram-positive bacteria) TaxID=84139 RepID=UPI0039E34EA2